MNKKMNDIIIKILLTVPALFVGILSALLYVFKPVIELWTEEKETAIQPIPQLTEEEKHEFH